MSKPLFALAAFGAAIWAMPAVAQESGESADDSYNMVIVYGDDACPESTGDTIVVCARKAESERYRIPKSVRLSDDPSNEAWAQRVEQLEMVGSFGTMSCSPTGAGGFTGCTQAMIREAYADKANSSDVRFGQLVDKARQERLSTIDEEATEEQKRVEMIEREYMERIAKEREADTSAEDEALPAPEGEPQPEN